MTHCPTPAKKRYATREGAESAARGAQISVGLLLNAYLCHPGCSWWHLSKKTSDITADRPVDPDALVRVAALDDIDLRTLAASDARGDAPLSDRLALRDPQLLVRWRKALGSLFHDVDEQLSMRADEKNTEWRQRTIGFRRALEIRRLECVDLLAAADVAAKAAWEEHAAEREEAKRVAFAAKKSASALRAVAGDAAVKRLIEAHGLEFCRYLVEECERLGTAAPDRILRRLDEAGGARLAS